MNEWGKNGRKNERKNERKKEKVKCEKRNISTRRER